MASDLGQPDVPLRSVDLPRGFSGSAPPSGGPVRRLSLIEICVVFALPDTFRAAWAVLLTSDVSSTATATAGGREAERRRPRLVRIGVFKSKGRRVISPRGLSTRYDEREAKV